jgi:hypothetical protein
MGHPSSMRPIGVVRAARRGGQASANGDRAQEAQADGRQGLQQVRAHASRTANQSIHRCGVREAKELGDGVVLKEWQRLPRQLLSEFCQREKRPSPRCVACSADLGSCVARPNHREGSCPRGAHSRGTRAARTTRAWSCRTQRRRRRTCPSAPQSASPPRWSVCRGAPPALTCGAGARSSQSSSPPCWRCATSRPGARQRGEWDTRPLTATQSAAGAQDARTLRSGLVGAAGRIPSDSPPVDRQALAVDAGTASHGHQRLRLAGCGAECGDGLMRAAGSRAQASSARKGRATKPSPCTRGHPGGRRAALLGVRALALMLAPRRSA